MPRSSRQKEKLLYLQKIMLEKTDENHALTAAEIMELLSGYGIQTERKALYDDLHVLETFGLDICRTRTSTVRYFVGSRDFEVAELKLLVDAIQSSKFITHSKSLRLIHKLEGLVSENEGRQLQREVVVTNRVKTFNEQIYYIVDEIHSAIKMENISIINMERDGTEKFEKFNLAHFAKSVFSMFGGEECEVKLCVDNDLIGVIVDRFGSDIYIARESENSFLVRINVILSPQFYAWLFGLGKQVTILSPERAKSEFKAKIQELSALY